jgi:hypothetical protein
MGHSQESTVVYYLLRFLFSEFLTIIIITMIFVTATVTVTVTVIIRNSVLERATFVLRTPVGVMHYVNHYMYVW